MCQAQDYSWTATIHQERDKDLLPTTLLSVDYGVRA